jgi:cephalosporin hydroxylase
MTGKGRQFVGIIRGWKFLVICGVILLVATVMLIPRSYLSQGKLLYRDFVIREFNRYHYNSNVWCTTHWLGVWAQQNPCDMWTMQEIISKIRPDFVVETGTANGGSSLFFAMILAYVNDKGRVITVDIDPQIESATKFEIFRERVEVIKGDSVSPEVIDRITRRVKGHTVLVTLDSLHTKDHVLNELKLYSKLVSTNSYLIVQDTNINGHPVFPNFGPGPMEAVKEFLAGNKDFDIDRSMERQMLTYYPSGYLKRVRSGITEEKTP